MAEQLSSVVVKNREMRARLVLVFCIFVDTLMGAARYGPTVINPGQLTTVEVVDMQFFRSGAVLVDNAHFAIEGATTAILLSDRLYELSLRPGRELATWNNVIETTLHPHDVPADFLDDEAVLVELTMDGCQSLVKYCADHVSGKRGSRDEAPMTVRLEYRDDLGSDVLGKWRLRFHADQDRLGFV